MVEMLIVNTQQISLSPIFGPRPTIILWLCIFGVMYTVLGVLVCWWPYIMSNPLFQLVLSLTNVLLYNFCCCLKVPLLP